MLMLGLLMERMVEPLGEVSTLSDQAEIVLTK